jgi:hypothetical protein|tara:strand:- start:637 stop:2058 length:1422 start_codon:yes stop_codon:yes gene_type:complete
MPAERIESKNFKYGNDIYRTVTTIEDDNPDPKKSEVVKIISKAQYDKIAEDSGSFDDLSIQPDGKYAVKLFSQTGAITNGKDGKTFTDQGKKDSTIIAELEKTGKNSLVANLNGASINAIALATPNSVTQVRENFPVFSNTEDEKSIIESIKDINFSSDDVPLTFEAKNRRKKYQVLAYPSDIRTSKQDRIIFGMKTFAKKRSIRLNLSGTDGEGIKVDPLNISDREFDKIIGSVTLPIPGGIQDKNSVKFEGENLDILGALGAGVILNPGGAVQAGADFLRQAVNLSPEDLARALNSETGSNLVSALRIGLAQQFTGTNLFSRLGGGILNPNMELLFQAPTLRTFNFTFTMSARDNREAIEIKNIIRFFKQGMSVKKSNDNIFIVSPNIFSINYKLGKSDEDHPSIGKIKDCALTDLNTSYGNGNTYMTYDDPERTMTQYKIDLTFQELTPITEDDYDDPGAEEGTKEVIGF